MRILIELPTWLGDAVMATPAIENLANFQNEVEITLIGSFVSIEVLKNHPKVIKTLVLDEYDKSLEIGFDKEMELYHNNATVITKPLFILENLVFRDNGKFEMKNS